MWREMTMDDYEKYLTDWKAELECHYKRGIFNNKNEIYTLGDVLTTYRTMKTRLQEQAHADAERKLLREFAELSGCDPTSRPAACVAAVRASSQPPRSKEFLEWLNPIVEKFNSVRIGGYYIPPPTILERYLTTHTKSEAEIRADERRKCKQGRETCVDCEKQAVYCYDCTAKFCSAREAKGQADLIARIEKELMNANYEVLGDHRLTKEQKIAIKKASDVVASADATSPQTPAGVCGSLGAKGEVVQKSQDKAGLGFERLPENGQPANPKPEKPNCECGHCRGEHDELRVCTDKHCECTEYVPEKPKTGSSSSCGSLKSSRADARLSRQILRNLINAAIKKASESLGIKKKED